MIEPLTRRSLPLVVALVLSSGACGDDPTGAESGPTTLSDQVRLPPGFSMSVWARDVVRPRSLTLGADGTVYVGTFYFTKGRQSPVIALRDDDGDGAADFRHEIWHGFNTPNGVAYHDGTLFIVDEERVLRIDDVEDNLTSPTVTEIYGGLPPRSETDLATDRGHWWRYIEYGPDDKLYVSVGTRWSFLVGAHTANDLTDAPHYSTIVRMNPDGSGVEIFADGVRNSMGLAFHPESGDLWFTENGPSWPFQDSRFYDIPADELNRAPTAGRHFGFPYVHGETPDPLIGGQAPAVVPPAHAFNAHTAPLGLEFYTGDMFPAEYRNRLFIAEHGTEPDTPAPSSKIHGNRISVVELDAGGGVARYEVFGDGWFDPARARFADSRRYTRRPVDLLVLPDGSMLVTDDWANMIYRITYAG